MLEHVLTLNSLRVVDRDARTVGRVEGMNPPTANERRGQDRRYEHVGPIVAGSAWVIVWGVEIDSAGELSVRRTRTAKVVTSFASLPAREFAWVPIDADGDHGGLVVTGAAGEAGPPLACTATRSAAFVLSWLLNLAVAATSPPPGSPGRAPFSVEGEFLLAGGVQVATAERWDEQLVGRLNALAHPSECADGLLAAAGSPPLELPFHRGHRDAVVLRELRRAGLTNAELRRLDPDTAHEVLRLTGLLCEHLAWEETAAWWRSGSPSPLELVLTGDHAGAVAAVSVFLHEPAAHLDSPESPL